MSKTHDRTPDYVNDPKNYRPKEEPFEKEMETKTAPETEKEAPRDLSRRNFLKIGGVTAAAAAAATVGGGALAGYQIGNSSHARTGYKDFNPENMFFNRKPFTVDTPPAFVKKGKLSRPEWYEFFPERKMAFYGLLKSGAWNPKMGIDTLPGEIGDYYRANPAKYELSLKQLMAHKKREQAWKEGKFKRYIIASGYSSANHAAIEEGHGSEAHTFPARPATPPEEWDFRNIKLDEPMKFKSKKHASELVKRMAHAFGATLVGITDFDPTFMFKNHMRGMPGNGHDGENNWGDKVPQHWKSMIVIGIPMNWDTTLSAIGYSTSYDGYSRCRQAAGKLEHFLNYIGYPARAQVPPFDYEVMIPPYALKAGLGEHSRAGLLMAPELGSNIRLCGVVTDIDFEYDKPIDIKMTHFCEKCKICAETCPSGAISFADRPDQEAFGFKRWVLDSEKCALSWAASPTEHGDGCRICIGVCPYTRKNTWIHTISREVEPRDPTGLFASGLLAMQHGFFKYPEAEDFKSDWDGGKEATYHNPPKWLRSEEWFENVDKNWEYQGL